MTQPGRPKAMQGEKQILKGHWLRSPDQYIGGFTLHQVRWELSIERPADAGDAIDCPDGFC